MTRLSAREKLLAAAADCFYSDGVQATGIDTITIKAGVAKMSLYNNFASKDQLVLAYLQMRHQEWLTYFETRLRTADGPRAKVLAVFDAYLDHAHGTYRNGFRGCGLLNAAAELPSGSPGRQAVRVHKEEVESLIAQSLVAAELNTERARILASHLSLLLEGAMSRAGLEGADRLLVSARRIAERLIDDALSESAVP